MFGFNGLNFNSIGYTSGAGRASDMIDLYDQLNEKKNNYIATKLVSNDKKRASATVIGAVGGLLQAGILTGVYALTKAFPKLNVPLIDSLITKNFDRWIDLAKVQNPTKSKFHNIFLGLASKYIWAMASGAFLGFAFNTYNTCQNTKINGKIANTKTGANGTWIASGLKSLSANETGKNIIKNSIVKNKDKSITVKFNGINKEYNITKKELKSASKAYIAITNEEGNVIGFERKFSKGDGDILAFEVAFEKYCKDVQDGIISKDKHIDYAGEKINKDGDILFRNGNVNQLYYLLTGENTYDFDTTTQKNTPVMDMYTEIGLSRFIQNFAQNKKNFAGEITLKNDDKKNVFLRDRFYKLNCLSTDKNYSITNISPKYITISNAEKTRETYEIPISKLNSYIASAKYVDLKTQDEN